MVSNGYCSLEFAIRDSELIAGAAQFGDTPGFNIIDNLPVTGARAAFRKIDMPVIVLDGCCEPNRHFPLREAGSNYRPGQPRGV